MSLWEAILLAIVEGLTEFLPVSSTGHMILVSAALGIADDPFTKFFEVAVQLGAILAVVALYHKKFLRRDPWRFYLTLAVGVIPALILGKLLSDYIDQLLESPLTVAVMLFIGGLVFLFIDKIFPEENHRSEDPSPSFLQALIIGLWQCLALVPGVSRSAASIIGGLQQGLGRHRAAEFSFFLAVPTMAAATLYKGYQFLKISPEITKNTQILGIFLAGNITAFLVAMAAMKFFVQFLQKHGFRLFGWYRLILGGVILLLHFSGAAVLK
ncbi:MAG: undecaprenyl-diphosphate phosphatase [Flavobacteriales bacterium]|nr:undecaprenyl-diphosphate phosphatase [Flavobacteriales bacterium]MDW8432163.1 undecaprenyl-diphosphate phosphatase [Flavobacteriales bacterium]